MYEADAGTNLRKRKKTKKEVRKRKGRKQEKEEECKTKDRRKEEEKEGERKGSGKEEEMKRKAEESNKKQRVPSTFLRQRRYAKRYDQKKANMFVSWPYLLGAN